MLFSKKRKAQAALEYLSTYGWALLVIAVALGALTYFGLFNTDRLQDDECIAPPGLICDDFASIDDVSGEELKLNLINDYGVNIRSDANEVEVSISGGPRQTCTSSPNIVPVGSVMQIRCPHATYSDGDRTSATIFVEFNQEALGPEISEHEAAILINVRNQ